MLNVKIGPVVGMNILVVGSLSSVSKIDLISEEVEYIDKIEPGTGYYDSTDRSYNHNWMRVPWPKWVKAKVGKADRVFNLEDGKYRFEDNRIIFI